MLSESTCSRTTVYRLRVIAAVVSGTLLLSACGADRDGGGTATGADDLVTQLGPAVGDVESVTWALPVGEPDTLDPINAVTYSSGAVVQNLCEPLLATRPDFTSEPGLATAEVISPTEIVYTINENATFWDGSPVTAEDVAFSLSRSADPNAVVSFMYINVAAIEVTGPDQVTVTFTQPDELFNNEMASLGGVIVKKAYVEEVGADFGSPNGGLMCSGPFQLESWVSGSSITIVRSDDYWKGEPRPFAQKVEFVFVTDSTALTQALDAGEIDGAYELPANVIPALQDSDSGRVVFGPSSQSVSMTPASPDTPFADPDFLAGFNLAIDREALADAVFHGAATPNYTLLTPATWPAGEADLYAADYEDYREERAYDPDSARVLIEGSDYDGGELVLGILAGDETASRTAQVVQQQAEAVGVEIRIEPLQPLVYGQAGYDPSARVGLDLYLSSSFNAVADPLEPLGFVLLPGQPYNYTEYDDVEVTRLLTEARGEFDPEVRAGLVLEAQAIYEETAGGIPLVALNTATFLNDRLTGAVTSFAYWSMPQMAYIGAAE
jgi:peptide/nickel transport system substrate-binding protein